MSSRGRSSRYKAFRKKDRFVSALARVATAISLAGIALCSSVLAAMIAVPLLSAGRVRLREIWLVIPWQGWLMALVGFCLLAWVSCRRALDREPLLETAVRRIDSARRSTRAATNRKARREAADSFCRELSSVAPDFVGIDLSDGVMCSRFAQNALAFGLVDFDDTLFSSNPGYDGDNPVPLSWLAAVDAERAKLADVCSIWASALHGVPIGRSATNAAIRELGRDLGVEEMVRAYSEGVPVEDIVAG